MQRMDKGKLGLGVMLVMAGIQIAAWILGKDGVIVGLTSLVIGGIAGSLFGFSAALKKK